MLRRQTVLAFILLIAVCSTPEGTLAQSQAQNRTQSTLIGDTTPRNAPSARDKLSSRISLNLQETSLLVALVELQQKAGILLTYSYDLLPAGKRVTLNLEDITTAEALAQILQDTGLDYFVLESGQITIGPKARVDQETGIIVGRVLEARTSKSLPGANVVVEGTTFGAGADAEGNYRIERVPPGTYKLRASIIGYRTTSQEITVAAGQEVTADFFLEEAAINLDEVVVVAYGTTSKRFTTGNIATISAADIVKQPVGNPLLSLAGRIPGVSITQATGFPGSGVQVQIQGINSIGRGNDPLYVVDGVPYPTQALYTLSRIQGASGGGPDVAGAQTGTGNPLSFINPADIERIDVLKDADATAIYGSRAAQGAVLITTRKGVAGPLKVSVNAQTGWGTVANRLDVLNAQQFLEMRNEAMANDGATPRPNDYDLNGTWDASRSTNWHDALIGGTAEYTDVQTTLSGGDAQTQYLASAGYRRETTVFPGDLADRKGSVHFNLNNVSASGKLRVQLSGSYVVGENRLINRDLTEDAKNIVPVAPALYNADGTINWQSLPNGNATWRNPLSYLNQRYVNNTNNIISNVIVSYELLPGLDLKTSLGYNRLSTEEFTAQPHSSILPQNRVFSSRSAQFNNNSIRSWIVEPQATYRTEIGGGVLEALVGSTIHDDNKDLKIIETSGHTNDLVLEDAKAGPNVSLFSGSAAYRYAAVFGRLNYIWREKYVVNLSARRDGSSRFGPQNRFHTFGSVGAAWIFSAEDFFQGVLKPLSFGKIRASYGTTGNDQVGDYQYLALYNSVFVDNAYQGIVGLEPTRLPNPYLQWEETKKLQFGLDLGLFDDRIFFNATYYRNRSSNQLLSYSLPQFTGFTGISRNFPANVDNFGWEFNLNSANVIAGDLVWTANLNLTIPRNKLVDFPDLATSSYANQLVIGEPVTITKVYRFAGVNPTTGVYQFYDANGNLTSSPSFTDRKVIINRAPTLLAGFQNTLRYGDFEMDFHFQYVKKMGYNGDYLFGNGRAGQAFGTSNIGNQPVSVLDRWRSPGDVTSIQRYYKLTNFTYLIAGINALSTDAAYTDASYLRLKNLSISWKIPAVWREWFGLQNARIYVQGQNLLTFTSFKGLDPETSSSRSLPPLRVWTFGLQVSP